MTARTGTSLDSLETIDTTDQKQMAKQRIVSTSINGNQNQDTKMDSGAAYVFVREGSSWMQRAYTPVLKWTLGHKTITLVAAFMITVASLGLTAIIPVTLFPSGGTESDNLAVLGQVEGLGAPTQGELPDGALVGAIAEDPRRWPEARHRPDRETGA